MNASPIITNDHWLENFLAWRTVCPAQLGEEQGYLKAFKLNLSHEVALRPEGDPFIGLLRQSGLWYGFPLQFPFEDLRATGENLSDEKKIALIFMEMVLFFSGQYLQSPSESIVANSSRHLMAYFHGLNAAGDKHKGYVLEDILLDRISWKKNSFNFKSLGINTHLFWDLFYFFKYLQAVQSRVVMDGVFFQQLLQEKKYMKITTIQYMAGAAMANHTVSKEEKGLLHQFEISKRWLTKPERKMVHSIIASPPLLEQLPHLAEYAALARQFLLDISMLTLTVDGDIDEIEAHYSQRLLEKLQLPEDTMGPSKAALGYFILVHGDSIHLRASERSATSLLLQAAKDNFKALGHAAKMEAIETKEMAIILSKLLKNKLTWTENSQPPSEAEIAAAIAQLKDLPRFLPFLAVLVVPVPGITELYVVTASLLERMSGNSIQLLPSQFSKLLKKKPKN